MNQTYIEDEEGDHSQKNIVNIVHCYGVVINTVEWGGGEDEGQDGVRGLRHRSGNTNSNGLSPPLFVIAAETPAFAIVSHERSSLKVRIASRSFRLLKLPL